MKDRTTIQITKELRKAIGKKRKYPRETYDDLLQRELKIDLKKIMKQ